MATKVVGFEINIKGQKDIVTTTKLLGLLNTQLILINTTLGEIDKKSGKSLNKLKKDFDFRLLVDDAHGLGTMGATGAGTGEHFGVQDEVDLYFGTFAKSMALIGAFVAGDQEIITYLMYNMRS